MKSRSKFLIYDNYHSEQNCHPKKGCHPELVEGRHNLYENIFPILRTLIYLFLLSISLSANEIEWEKVEGADFYEIEVINSQGEKVKKITTKETKVDLKIEIAGKYRYRIGAADNGKRVSWTNWIDFRVQKYSDKTKEKIVLEWELQQLAEVYKIQVSNDSGKIIYEEKLNSNKTYLNLGIGKYQYRVASINELGKEAWSDWESFEVKLKTWEIPYELEKPNMANTSDEIDNLDSCGLRCNVVKRSGLLPGWGQSYRNDPKWRVYIYPIIFSSLFVAYYKNHKENISAEKDYDSAIGAMVLAQGYNSDASNLLTYYSYSKVLNSSAETKNTYSQGNTISLLIILAYIINLTDAYFFYDYSVPISDRYKKSALSFQHYNSYFISAGIKDAKYEVTYSWNF